MDQTALMLLLCLCSSALSDELRLVAGRSRCVGRLEKKDLGDWEPVIDWNWDLTSAAGACRQLHCGSVVSLQRDENYNVEIVCSDSVRLVQGTNRCSGRLEVRTNQSWSSVCEKDFDLQDAEVVCREISCGPPSVHQGALYGEVEATVGSREFLCEGSESALLNCSSRKSSGRNSCSPGQAVGLTCSDQDNFRLVGEASRCAGRLEMLYQEEWRPVDVYSSYWNMNSVAAVCAELDCGSAVSARDSKEASKRPVWGIWSDCFQSGSELKNCLPYDENGDRSHEIICSDSVRLVQGTNRCSGRLEVKTDQSWSSVCEKDFDLQDAEVVCREIGCGPPSVHQGALYGEAEAPVGSREFLCEGSESALLNCSSRKSSGRNSCSPGQAVGLTCSDQDNFRLVGEASRCAGRLEMLHQEEWRPVDVSSRYWDKNSAAAVCAELDCGSAVSARNSKEASKRPVWGISSDCFQSGSALKKCLPYGRHRDQSHEFICSDSVRLVQGTNRCSGRLEVKTDQSWSSVCEKDFDLQDAEVVCREIGCGPPSAHQGALYGEAEAPVGSREFLCEGSESALLNCSSRKSSGRNSCSPGQAVGLTCSDNFRLVGEASRCAGRLEMIHQEEWRPVAVWLHYWNMNSVAVVCAKLDCGSAVSARNSEEASERPVWWISSDCFQSGSALKNCLPYDENSYQSHEIICSGLLVEPLIFLSSSTDGVSTGRKQGSELLIGSHFSIMCSIRPQYEGGSFQLIFSTSNYTQNQTLPAVNHSALFLFSAAGHAHQGTYRCVYHVYVFSYNFSSISQPLNLTVSGKLMESIRKSSASVSASPTALIIRLVVVLLGMLGSVLVLYFKARRNQKSGPENNHHDEGSRAEGSLEEETAV
ncbi:scavenger receptor cysteine-rich type 1 protein M160-like isoform X4 [Xiphophorus hellerii]|uniref:scavenger receptor cysteine-rich type 1 protein M160-like isoform X4 n=1 Tax=Xiphophorus hellerii TaxID=8084 RepID=UPI0013B426FE|nr:scavenger receptor cysteine-rich type 1 protein M160-like isoform X4 [Xiphophorus hellerii]XP_032446827.1 scavenger receptor cysteine-rich type 1 protein M160-like isoform X4 [Xiphophorus hellerii]